MAFLLIHAPSPPQNGGDIKAAAIQIPTIGPWSLVQQGAE